MMSESDTRQQSGTHYGQHNWVIVLIRSGAEEGQVNSCAHNTCSIHTAADIKMAVSMIPDAGGSIRKQSSAVCSLCNVPSDLPACSESSNTLRVPNLLTTLRRPLIFHVKILIVQDQFKNST